MPRATNLLRLITFTVPAFLFLAGVQPLLAAATGQVGRVWAFQLAGPAIAAALRAARIERLAQLRREPPQQLPSRHDGDDQSERRRS